MSKNKKKWERIDSDRAPSHADAYDEGANDAWQAALDAAMDKITDIDASCDASAGVIEKAVEAIRALQQRNFS